MQLLGTCSQLLVALFQTHRIDSLHNDGIVSVPDHPMYRFALQVYKSGEKTVLLEAICQFGSGQVMTERLAGIGETQNQAVVDAQNNFVTCVFHVWVSALLGKSNPQVTEYVWEVDGTDRKITVGFAGGRGDLEIARETGWQNAWHREVRSLCLSREVHWASLCYVQHAGKLIACDALLDNEACEPLKQRVLQYEWPARNKFYSVRQFVIIQKAN